jgi:hypothetical protein
MIGSIGATGGIVSPIFSRWMKDLTGGFYELPGSMGLLLPAMRLRHSTLRQSARAAKGIARIASKRWRKVSNTFMQTIVQH